MITEQDVKTYTHDGVFWLEAADEVEASCSTAWQAIELLILRLIEVGTSAGTEFALDKRGAGASLVAEGTRIAALATAMGIFKAAAVITFDDVEPARRAHCSVSVLGVPQGEIEFVVEPIRDGACRITYRQGIRGQETRLGVLETTFTAGPRQVPEVVEIHNAWRELILDPSP